MKKQTISRKIERIFVLLAGIWQIFNGLLTIFIYAPYYRREGLDLINYSVTAIQAEAISSVFGNLYMFIVTFGMIYIVIGLFIIYLSRKIVDNKVIYVIPILSLITGLVAYFIMDFISVIFCLSAGGLAMAKNKAIKELQANGHA